MQLKDKTIIVTGGTSGIGLSIAIRAKEKGAKVIVLGRDEKKLESAEVQEGLEAFRCDVRNEEAVNEFFRCFRDENDTLDALINNAGYGSFGKLDELNTEDFDDLFATNVRGAMLMAKEASVIFKEQGYGNIVNISSTAGLKGFAGGTAYVGTKFALKGMSECWRAELRPHNVRVILVNPSEVQTSFFSNAGITKPSYNESKLRPEEISHAVISALEMDDRGFIPELTVFATNPKD